MDFDKEITCRVCLKENNPKITLFDSGGIHHKILSNTIGVEVAENEFFPSKICINCTVSLEYIDNHVKSIKENEKKLRNMLLNLARSVANKKPLGTAAKKPRSAVEEHKEMVVVIEKLVHPTMLNQDAEEEEDSRQAPKSKTIETIIKTEPKNSIESNEANDDNFFDDEPNVSEEDFEYDDDDGKPLGVDTILEENEDISVDYSEDKTNQNDEDDDSESVDNDDPDDKDYNAPIGIPNYDPNLRCKKCDIKFSRPSNYNSHMIMHQTGKSVECDICHKKFIHAYALRKHKSEHKPKRAQRENFRHLYKYVRDPETGKTLYECLQCQNRFERPGSVVIHVKTHQKKYVCPFCGKNFASQHYLAQHENIHTGNKPYKCDFCPMTFAQLSSQADHRKIHTEIHREYQCDLCPKAFNHKRNLTLHRRRHSMPRQTIFNCDMCDDFFRSRLSLRKHVIIAHPDYVFDKEDGKKYSIDKKTREELMVVRKHRRRSENEREELKKQQQQQGGSLDGNTF